MNHWVMAFVGDGARENYELTRRTNAFYVSSNRTPIRRAKSGDRVLFYRAGEGFAARARISSPARVPSGMNDWSSKKPPLLQIEVEDVHAFDEPILYRFPGDGNHPALGFHRYGLTSGFLAIPQSGFEDVLGWARPDGKTEGPAREHHEEPAPKKGPASPSVPGPRRYAAPSASDPGREKRSAGQHALYEGRKRLALWTVAEMGASLFGLEGVERHARGKARAAEQTWISGGRAEARVGEELERLRSRGFYVFHDVPLSGVGNVDHVALGPTGFFAIETKSHAGRVSSRGGEILRDGRPFEKDFVKQAWRGCYRLREILASEVAPLLLFTEAFVEGRVVARGVRVLPLKWVVGEILVSEARHDAGSVKVAVAKLSAATGCHPSAAPRPA